MQGSDDKDEPLIDTIAECLMVTELQMMTTRRGGSSSNIRFAYGPRRSNVMSMLPTYLPAAATLALSRLPSRSMAISIS